VDNDQRVTRYLGQTGRVTLTLKQKRQVARMERRGRGALAHQTQRWVTSTVEARRARR